MQAAQVIPLSHATSGEVAIASSADHIRPKLVLGSRSPHNMYAAAAGGQPAVRLSAPHDTARGVVNTIETLGAKGRAPIHAAARLGNRILDSPPMASLVMLATFWTLVAEDVRVGADVPMAYDSSFTLVTSCCFFLFLADILIALAARPSYYRSAYFAFDMIATATLVPEMPWVTGAFAAQEEASGLAASEAASVLRPVRLLRLLRLIRLLRFVKLYKYVLRKLTAREADGSALVEGRREGPSWRDNPSAVGRALQEAITLQVVVGVLLMLIVFPLLSVREARQSADYDLELVEQVDRVWRAHRRGSGTAAAAARALVESAASFQRLVYLEMYDGSVLLEDPARMPPNVRASEYRSFTGGPGCAPDGAGCSLGGFFERDERVLQAHYSLGLLAFVLLLLVVGVILFNRIALRYCIAPIEKLFALVNSFAKDPMAKLGSYGNDSLEELNELEQSIRKIASLLQVGIGLAGRETISRCLRTSGDINPIAMGIKVNCLFGFCDIRQFTDTTECLQEQVMLFTNMVGHIVHHAVHECGGFANKNIGDAFLVAWTGESLEARIAQVGRAERNRQVGALFTDNELELQARASWAPTVGDYAMASFIRLTVCVRGATAITELVQNAALQKRVPGYTVRLGCGLHVGWAIEGALGTQKKIDATYLSPATNITMALEAATKQYGNLLLISEETYKLFSPFVRTLVRRIDRVYVSAGAEPFDLYTYDLPTSLSVHPDEAKERAMAEHCFDFPLAISPEFREQFGQALQLYLQGEWADAKPRFEAANELLVRQAYADRNLDAPDKPTLALLRLMAASNYKAPEGWAGCRQLE